jgi:hypothetical protein
LFAGDYVVSNIADLGHREENNQRRIDAQVKTTLFAFYPSSLRGLIAG